MRAVTGCQWGNRENRSQQRDAISGEMSGKQNLNKQERKKRKNETNLGNERQNNDWAETDQQGVSFLT